MKPMIYQTKRIREILHTGTYKHFNFIIVSYGTHPCAYVEIPKTHFWYNQRRWELVDKVMDCHGGMTYEGNLSHVLGEEESNDKWFVGWDYAHCGDYFKSDFFVDDGKKWTTKEIVKEVKQVIDRIINWRKKEELEQ